MSCGNKGVFGNSFKSAHNAIAVHFNVTFNPKISKIILLPVFCISPTAFALKFGVNANSRNMSLGNLWWGNGEIVGYFFSTFSNELYH